MDDKGELDAVVDPQEMFRMYPCRNCGRTKPIDRSCICCRQVAAFEAFTEALMDIRRMLAKRWEADD